MVEEAVKDLTTSHSTKTIKKPGVKPIDTSLSSLKKNAFRFWPTAAAGFLIVAGFILIIRIFMGNSLFSQQELGLRFSTDVPLVRAKIQSNVAIQPSAKTQSNFFFLLKWARDVTSKIVPKNKVKTVARRTVESTHDHQNSDDKLKTADTEESELNRRTPTHKTLDVTTNTSRFIVVAPGDSLYKIILREYGEYDEIKLNAVLRDNLDVTNPDLIIEGQVIMLPALPDNP